MLKADLHLHAKEDRGDRIEYTAKELIDKAAEKGFDVLSLTFHIRHLDGERFFDEINNYAKEKGILLIPGTEAAIEGKHVLMYNFLEEELNNLKHFEDIYKLNRNNKLIIAAHPYFKKKSCLGKNLIKYIDLFDGIEFSFFYNRLINFNKKAIKVAKKHNKTLIANSDCHFLELFGRNYTLIDSKKDVNSVIEAIKKGKVEIKSKPISILQLFKILFKFKKMNWKRT